MTSIDWSGVRDRVAELATLPEDAVFGANGHHFLLEPPLAPEELAELEEQLGVVLPEEYRSFLLTVSRGGAGPFYGLFPLRRIDGRWRWEGDGAELTDLATLAAPFPHTTAFDPAAAGLPEPPDEADYASVEEFEAAERTYWKRHNEAPIDPAHTVGTIVLCHQGCGYRDMLVVSGPERGAMWTDDTPGDGGYRPLLDPRGDRIGFARWYLDWLDKVSGQRPQPTPAG